MSSGLKKKKEQGVPKLGEICNFKQKDKGRASRKFLNISAKTRMRRKNPIEHGERAFQAEEYLLHSP